jgi:hypothetical protein
VQGAAPPAASESAATMSGVSFRYSEVGVRKVRRVQFGILGPEELKASSTCNIVTDRTFENGKPIPGGLMDPALGAIDRLLNLQLQLAKKCFYTQDDCARPAASRITCVLPAF